MTGRQRRWLAWWDDRPRSLAFDLAVAAAPIAGEFYSHGGRLPDISPLVVACLVVSFLALAVRRRFPLATAVAAALVSLFGGTVIGVMEIALYTVASRRGPRWQTGAASGITVLTVLGTVGLFGEFTLDETGNLLGVLVLNVAVPALLGLWVFQRVSMLSSYEERAEQAERERELLAERAVAAERRSIAREMHDVVAHRVGIVSLHAGALAMNASDERSSELAENIRTASTTAMSELRDMLRALRDDDSAAEPATAPGLAGIAELVDGRVRAGSNIRLTTPDPVPSVSPAVGRAAYRVVQEALTNAAKHAPYAAVHVGLAVDEEELTVTVTNRRGPAADPAALPSSGYGLLGMRERVALAGGTVQAGCTDDGGYRVHAGFPRSADEQPSVTP